MKKISIGSDKTKNAITEGKRVSALAEEPKRFKVPLEKGNAITKLDGMSEAIDKHFGVAKEFEDAMDDDLNISEAEAAVFEFMNLANKLMAENKLSKKEAMGCIKQMRAFDTILGILDFEEEKIPEEITGLVKKREGARKNKEWKLADELRGKIKKKGYSIDDTDSGSVVKKL